MPFAKRSLLWLRFVWLLSLFVVGAGEILPGDARAVQLIAGLPLGDKAQHFAAYAVLAFLPALHERVKLLALIGIGLVALGVLLEFGQLVLPGRSFELYDMVANTTGVCAGLAVALVLRTFAA